MGFKSSDKQNIHRDLPLDPATAPQKVMLREVDSADDTFRITTGTDDYKLARSIQELGLLNPPVLQYDSPQYVIICGFRRIAACRRLGWEKIPARILSKDFGRFELAQLAIADNALQRSLNLLETSRALKLLTDTGTVQKQLKKALLDLGLPSDASAAAKIEKLCRLPLKIQEGILTNTINMSMALELGRLAPDVAEGLVALFGQLKMGLNRQRELLLLLKEIAEREDISILQLIAEAALQQILKNAELDGALRRQKIRSYLRQRRFPTISQAEETHANIVKQLKLGNDINLIPPKDFEGMTYTLRLRFGNREDLHRVKEKLEKIIHHPSFDKILDR